MYIYIYVWICIYIIYIYGEAFALDIKCWPAWDFQIF